MRTSRSITQCWGLAASVLAVLFLFPVVTRADSLAGTTNLNAFSKADVSATQAAHSESHSLIESLRSQIHGVFDGLKKHLKNLAPDVQAMYRDSIVEVSASWKPLVPPVRDLQPFSGPAPFRDLVYGPQEPVWWSELRSELSTWDFNFSWGESVPRSGVIVSEDGLILTSSRAVEWVAFPRVKLADGRRFPARVIGSDEDTGLALLKIDATGLKAVAFDSPLLRGAAELARSASAGSMTVLSWKASGRDEPGQMLAETQVSFLASASGNELLQFGEPVGASAEGGLVVNRFGVPIGIVTTPEDGIGVLAGSSFARPLATVTRTIAELKSQAPLEYLQLGMRLEEALDMDPGVDEVIDELPEVHLAPKVASVEPGSLADQAGLREGDVIVWLNDQPVTNATEFRDLLSCQPELSDLEFGVSRENQNLVLQVSPQRRFDRRLSGAPARTLH